ncbi:MAG: PorT family protein [Bacteroidales bacterium]|nr:PorT family protein [Bacteroidales bacterium]MCM1146369.1 PorT family protein [Bacteroidales bacterium]MCM1205193.1 PorT family protein [Bacillota bacterium]MCM1509440.1 PorT family protein [Clostridium sp.]
MKKLFITLVCAAFALTGSAQRASSSSTSFFSTESSDQAVTFGIRAGVNFASMSFSYDGGNFSPNGNTGFHAGVAVDFPLMKSLYVQSGLYYSVKGAKIGESDQEIKLSPAYLELPVLASYRYDFSNAAQLQFNVGPYFAYGVGGSAKAGDEKIDFFGGEDDDDTMGCKRFDMGLQVGAGVTLWRHYYVGVAYEFGFVDMGRGEDGSVKNKNFMLSVGYQF